MTHALSTGVATSIGSLPHDDPDEAVAVVLTETPDLPAAPQLPMRSPREGMIAQSAHSIRGVEVLDDGTLCVDEGALSSAVTSGVPVDATIGPAGDAGFLAFIDHIQGRRGPVKVQVTGPVTLGLALARAGVPCQSAFAVAGEAVQARMRALVQHVASRAPDAPVVAFLDEPSLAAAEHPGFPLAPHAVVDLLTAVLCSGHGAAATGVHCCGPIDWRLVVDAGPEVLSLPVALAGSLDPSVLRTFLGGGGWVAWGAVPTDSPVSDDASFLWRRLVGVWCDLVRDGCPSLPLREHSIVTPACGLAGHGRSQADRALRLTAELGRRMQDHAGRRRLTIGA